MLPIKIGIVEDELLIAESISIALENCGYQVAEPANTFEAALQLLQQEKLDLILLDINLKSEKDGIDLAEIINQKYKIPFIFLSGNALSVDRAKKTNPLAFLVKPFMQENLFASIEVCLYNYNIQKSQNDFLSKYMFVKDKLTYIKIFLHQILYIQSNHVYVDIYTTTRKIVVRNSITDILREVNDVNFMQVHRGFIINTNFIEQIHLHYLIINNTEIPIGKTYEDQFKIFLNQKTKN